MALVPAFDPAAPDDWFLFVGNDNDFITTTGFQDGAVYAGSLENDTMVLVYRLTLPGRLVNVASRAQTGAGSDSHILSFVVTGARPKSMLIRGTGPALVAYGLTGALADPTLAVYDVAGRSIYTNDNWSEGGGRRGDSTAANRSGAFALIEGSKDAAVVVSLDPGVYSIQVSSVGAGTGISLIEVYELP